MATIITSLFLASAEMAVVQKVISAFPQIAISMARFVGRREDSEHD